MLNNSKVLVKAFTSSATIKSPSEVPQRQVSIAGKSDTSSGAYTNAESDIFEYSGNETVNSPDGSRKAAPNIQVSSTLAHEINSVDSRDASNSLVIGSANIDNLQHVGPPERAYPSSRMDTASLNRSRTIDVELNTNNEEFERMTVEHPEPISLTNPSINKQRYIIAMIWIFTSGFSDASPGILLPKLEAYYHINYSIVSLIWCGNAIGFLAIAIFSDKIQTIFGKHKAMILGTVSNIIGYSLVASGTHVYPVIVIAFVLYGVGVAINLSQLNIFVTRLNNSFQLGIFHSFYGIGATFAPILGTIMVDDHQVDWNVFYLIPLCLMCICFLGMVVFFKNYDEDIKIWDANYRAQNFSESDGSDINVNDITDAAPATNHDDSKSVLKSALTNRLTWLLAIFTLFYQGSEVSLAGWIVTFLLDYRHGNSSSVGYVASGFWFGITIGRFGLTSFTYRYLNARRGILLFTCISIGFVILSWVVPQVIVSGTMISICGIFVGPIYPVMIGFAARLFPRKIQVVSLTMLSAFGSSGGALFPFITGLISEKSGSYVVLPISIGLLSMMVMIWLSLPYVERKGLAKHWWSHVW